MIFTNKTFINKNRLPVNSRIIAKRFSFFIGILFTLSFFSAFSQQAVINGDTTICFGGTVDLHLSLEGTAPWSVTIELNSATGGITAYPFTNIYQQDTVLQFDMNGDFSIVAASDKNGSIGFSTSNIVKANLFAPLTEAIITGNESICEEGSFDARIELRGNKPWNISYSYNGDDTIEVFNISSSPYYLNVSNQGTYKLLSVNDKYCQGTAGGEFKLSHYEKATANLVGGVEKCAEESIPLTVIFDGTAPYELEYMIDGEPDSVIQNITNSPFTFKVKNPGEYAIYEFKDYRGCVGIPSGSATVENYPAVEIDFVDLNSTYALNSLPVALEALPAGGEFKGDGVVTSTSMFYPEVAVDYGIEPYEIIYTYQQPTTGCIYNDTAFVNIIDSTANIIFPDGRELFCSNEEEVIIKGANIYTQTYHQSGSFSISGNRGLTDNNNDTAILDPSVLQEGRFIITYSYWNGSSTDAISREIEVERVESVFFILSETEFCGNNDRIELQGNKLEGIFNGSGIESDTTDKINYYFNPTKADVGINELVFSYETPTGCISKSSRSVQVHDVPRINFTTVDSCVNENLPRAIQFIDQTESEDEILSWTWNFDDFESAQNSSSQQNPTHVYEIADNYDVSLEVTTNEGCVVEGIKNIKFEESPLASFVFSSECLNPDTSILFVQTVPQKYDVVDYQWIFADNVGSEYFNGDSIYYKFSLLEEHLVKLIAKTSEGCVDTFEENIQLKPTFKISDGSYFQDFEFHNSYWENEFSKALNNNSWRFGATDGSFTQTTNNNAWYTRLEYLGEESSWVKSPCFDFRGVERPLVRFNVWRDFEEARDGANFQYTLDNGNTWNLVGTVGDGTNWYNSYKINANPGGHDEGWSNNIKDNNWVTVKHRLDELSGKTNVQFRLAYGSDGTNNENYGIAFDSIYISERNHVVLVEHFTNSSSTISLRDDSLINVLRLKNVNDLIDIQYHTDFPVSDPLNQVNPLEVNARLLYYGYSTVPLSIVDGVKTYDFTNNSLTNSDIIVKSLNDSDFEIDFEVTTENATLNIDYNIKSLKALSGQNLFLYITVLEDSVIQVIDGSEVVFMNTFRKFLPDPGGLSLPSSWNKNGTYSDSYSWEIENIDDIDNMKVALFIQDEQSNNVIQAAINKKLQPVNIRNHRSNKLNKINVYPNPFNSTLYISRGDIYGDLKIDLYSISGNLLSTSVLRGNDSNLDIDSRISSGFYFLRITELKTGYSETVRVIKN